MRVETRPHRDPWHARRFCRASPVTSKSSLATTRRCAWRHRSSLRGQVGRAQVSRAFALVAGPPLPACAAGLVEAKGTGSDRY
jgi:hypothetical protein